MDKEIAKNLVNSKEKPADDVAKEIWGLALADEGVYNVLEDGAMELVCRFADNATPAQRAAVAAAPEMLDALINVQNSYSSHDGKAITCVISYENWQKILDALKKSKAKYIK